MEFDPVWRNVLTCVAKPSTRFPIIYDISKSVIPVDKGKVCVHHQTGCDHNLSGNNSCQCCGVPTDNEVCVCCDTTTVKSGDLTYLNIPIPLPVEKQKELKRQAQSYIKSEPIDTTTTKKPPAMPGEWPSLSDSTFKKTELKTAPVITDKRKTFLKTLKNEISNATSSLSADEITKKISVLFGRQQALYVSNYDQFLKSVGELPRGYSFVPYL